VSVAPGTAAVALTTAGALTQLCRWDAAEVVTHAAAPPAGSSRIDLVVLQIRDNTLDSGGNNDFIFQAIAGAGGTPGPGAVPAVPTNAYPMGQLTVPGGAANLNGVTVVDRRTTFGILVPNRRVLAYATTAGGAIGGFGSGTQITYQAVDYNTVGSDLNMASGLFTASVAGWYSVSGAVQMTLPNVSGQIAAEVWKNGASFARLGQMSWPTAYNGAGPELGGTTEVHLNVGETAALVVMSNMAGTTLAAGTGPMVSWMAIALRALG
jgi:hypothetical protein